MKWISVEDRLPDHGRFLISDTQGWITIAFFDGAKWMCTSGEEMGLKPTHWMSLPEEPND